MTDVDDRPTEVDDLPEGTWSVSELTAEIEQVFVDADDRFPTYVVGEISDVNGYDFGTFFDLRDVEEEATISCLAWSYVVEKSNHDLEAGTTAVVRASVEFHAEKGNCQLIVRDYWPIGDSARRKQLAALREELDAEGLFDADRKRELPTYPSCIGVVTSLSGSAREDVCTAVHDRSPGTRVKLCGATVQGERAVESVIGGVERLDRDPDVEVLIVTRGGGADADLWCFNAEPLVRRIADCTTPTVVAIGHEDDRTLSDEVSDVRAMTPTDAGVRATPDVAVVRREVAGLERRVHDRYRALVSAHLDALVRRVESAHESLVGEVHRRRDRRLAQRRRAADLERRIDRAYRALVDARLGTVDDRLDEALVAVEHAAETEAVSVRAARGRVADLEARIDAAYTTRVEAELDALEGRVETAYRERETDERVREGTAEARRLRVVVAVLLVLLLVVAAVALGLV